MKWRDKVRELKFKLFILYQAAYDPRLPWYIRLLPWLVLAYALSPLDLIPDFIPVLGYLDDLLLIPLGIILALKLIPLDYQEEYQQKINTTTLPKLKSGIVITILIWVLLLLLIIYHLVR